ncbi:MAG: hypothetical protein KME18_02780 [Phormidium tanganyikae FI6-MK23]|jgi:hypothetical protein|nr:hypothetical protein [Phormidium tanganyikae FI6-MK23]
MTKPVGYFTECTESHHLMQVFGDLLEQLTSNEKLGLIAALTLWLSMDDPEDAHWTIPAIAHTNMFPSSKGLSRAAVIIEEMSPDDALPLIAALLEQLRDGVFAQ